MVGDSVGKMPDRINSHAVALGVLGVSSFFCYVAIDVRRSLQRLLPKVPLEMSKWHERLTRFNCWMCASSIWYLVVRHYVLVL